MYHRRHRGFTLVELLVVITIIGMLMSLLLPAVNAARESGRRATCQNNEHQLSLAMLNFESAHRYFPGYENRVGPDYNLGQYDDPPKRRLDPTPGSWVPVLFPYLDRNDLWVEWQKPKDLSKPHGEGKDPFVLMRILSCPSDPRSADPITDRDRNIDKTGDAPMAYVVNRGQGSMAEGVCHDLNRPQYKQDNPKKPLVETKVSLDYIGTHDGASTTLLLAEKSTTYDSKKQKDVAWTGNWYHYSKTTSTDPDMSGEEVIPSGNVSFGWVDSPEDVTSGRDPRKVIDHISSRHGGTIIVSFCDGHQYALREEIDYTVFQHLVTPYGAGCGVPADHPLKNTVLNEADY